MAVTIKSYNQILGEMITKIMTDTALTDFKGGSVISSILETGAQSDFESYAALAQILQLFSLDTTFGGDLDTRVSEYGLTRHSAQKSTGVVTIEDSSFNKQYTKCYLGLPPPIVGDVKIHVEDASLLSATGKIYIGRGTSSFEGPIEYTSVVPIGIIGNPSYWDITLKSPLTKNHSPSDTVIQAKGGNRKITSGTIVKTIANSSAPSVSFTIDRETIMLDGETVIDNVPITSVLPGTTNNISAFAIAQFGSAPFSGATVYNFSPIINGRDLESDEDLRSRAKNILHTLSRGTKNSIVSAVLGVSDSVDNKSVLSASLTEPSNVGQPALLYIDDGTGFEPSFKGQGIETVVDSAAGSEKFIQISKKPITPPIVISTLEEPFEIKAYDTLIIRVDEKIETITIQEEDIAVPNAAKLDEIINLINKYSELTVARTYGNRTKISLVARRTEDYDPEEMQIMGGTSNLSIGFPTNVNKSLSLYLNDVLLKMNPKSASVYTNYRTTWGFGSNISARIMVRVDGTPIQGDPTLGIALPSDTFSDYGTTLATATLDQWAEVLNKKIAGIVVTNDNDQRLLFKSNKGNSASASVEIIDDAEDDNIAFIMFGGGVSSYGTTSEYTLNRFSGQIELTNKLSANDVLTVGTRYTRGRVDSVPIIGNKFNIPINNEGTEPRVYLASNSEGSTSIRNIFHNIGTTYTISRIDSDICEITSSSSHAFDAIEEGDYLLLVPKTAPGWFDSSLTGLYVISSRISSTVVRVRNNTSAFSTVTGTVTATSDIQAFKTNGIVQSFSLTGQNMLTSQIIDLIHSQISFVKATPLSASQFRMESNSYNEMSSLDVVAVIGSARDIVLVKLSTTPSDSHVGYLLSNGGQCSFPCIESINQSIMTDKYSLNIVQGSVTGGSSVDPFQLIDSTKNFLTSANSNSLLVFLDDKNKNKTVPIRSINSATVIEMQTSIPKVEQINRLDKYIIAQPFKFGDNDRVVVILDDDETNKIYNIPLTRTAKVSTSIAPSNTSFSGIDLDNSNSIDFDNITWNKFNFADFDLVFRSRNVYVPFMGVSAGAIFRCKKYGSIGNNIRLGFVYPSSPTSLLMGSAVSTQSNIDISITLPSGDKRTGISSIGAGYNLYKSGKEIIITWNGIGSSPNFATNSVTVGDIVSLNDSSFTAFSSLFNDNGVVTSVSETQLMIRTKTSGSSQITTKAVTGVSYQPISGRTRYLINNSDNAIKSGQSISVTGFTDAINNISNKSVVQAGSTYFDVSGNNGVRFAPDFLQISSLSCVSNIITLNLTSNPDSYIVDGQQITISNLQVSLLDYNKTGVILDHNADSIRVTVGSASDIADTPVTPGYGNLTVYKDETKAAVATINIIQQNINGIVCYPVVAPSMKDVCDHVNNNEILQKVITAVPLTTGLGVVTLATYDEPSSVGYAHSVAADKISLFDGEFGVKSFNSSIGNQSHNFSLKSPMGISHPAYHIETAPNVAGEDAGERFKLIPTTSKNVKDFITLNAVSSISLTGDITSVPENGRIQIASNTLGYESKIKITGGYGNGVKSLLKSSGEKTETSIKVVINTPEADSLRKDQIVKVQNNSNSQKVRANTNDQIKLLPLSTSTSKIYSIKRYGTVSGSLVIASTSNPSIWTWTLSSGSWGLDAKEGDALYVGDTVSVNNRSTYSYLSSDDLKNPYFLVVSVSSDKKTLTILNPKGLTETVNVAGDNIFVVPPFISEYRTNLDATSRLSIKKLNIDGFCLLTYVSGSAPRFKSNGVCVDCFVKISDVNFSTFNRGYFKVVAVGEDYILYQNENAITEEGVNSSGILIGLRGIRFFDVNSIVSGDICNLYEQSASLANRGSHLVTEVGADDLGGMSYPSPYTTISIDNAIDNSIILITDPKKAFFYTEKTPYFSYRKISNICVTPDSPYLSHIYLTPSHDNDRISTSYNTQITPVDKFNFETNINNAGSDSYKYYTGLLATVQKIVDGADEDPVNYPGYRAAGTQIEVIPPLIKRVSINIVVKPKNGVSINTISNSIITTILTYLNSLGVGQDIILSEIIRRTMDIEGVESAKMSNPAPTVDRIVVEDREKVIAVVSDIFVSSQQ
jgi:uncharacterized phage protein gp47/JayE